MRVFHGGMDAIHMGFGLLAFWTDSASVEVLNWRLWVFLHQYGLIPVFIGYQAEVTSVSYLFLP